MRIHIQNPAADDLFAVTRAQWQHAQDHSGMPSLEATFGTTAPDFVDALASADVLVVSPKVLGQLLPLPLRLNRLRIVFCLAAGIERLMPLDWLPDHVALWNNRGAHGPKVTQYAAMALLLLGSQMPEMLAAQRAQIWKPVFTPTLQGRRLTVIGTGDLGASAAASARHFGMHVTGVRRSPEPHPAFDQTVATRDLDSVLPRSEFLLLACPLTAETRDLVDRRRLALLPPSACVINIGRGGLLDHDALCDMLEWRALGGAMLDVTDPEPPPQGHRLWTTTNLVLTAHVAADDPGTYNALSLDIFFANLRAYAAGLPAPNQVDRARGY